jgi:hypothetical protein
MKKPARKAKSPPYYPSTELRRWCIEMAVHWPVRSTAGYSQMGGGFQPPVHQDENVIGRAIQIFDWVTKEPAR